MDPATVSMMQLAATAVKWLASPFRWLWRRLVARSKGQIDIPAQTLIFVQEQGNSTWWHLGGTEDKPMMQVVCGFVATNISHYNIMVVGTRLRKPATTGIAAVRHHEKNLYSSRFMVMVNTMSQVHCHYWIDPPMKKAGEELVADVVLVDQFKNEHVVKDVRFRYL